MSVENIVNNPPKAFTEPCEACGVSEFQLGVRHAEERIIKLLENAPIVDACKVMHDAYEDAARQTGWETQERSRVDWKDLPEANKETMAQAISALGRYLIAFIKGETE